MKDVNGIIRVMHHDDPPCEARLVNGECPECKLHPDMQSLALWSYCKACQVPLEGIMKKGGGFEKGVMKCPNCKETFDLKEKKDAPAKEIPVPKLLDKVAELRGRKTVMEIVNVESGDKKFKYEIVHRPQAACAIVETIKGHKFIFIKQFRIPVNAEIFEAVAGCIDGDESPEDCIRREVEEETGYNVIDATNLVSVYASPGYSDEIIHAFYVRVNDISGKQRLDGEERIKVVELSFDEAERVMSGNGIQDAHTLIAWNETCKSQGWL